MELPGLDDERGDLRKPSFAIVGEGSDTEVCLQPQQVLAR